MSLLRKVLQKTTHLPDQPGKNVLKLNDLYSQCIQSFNWINQKSLTGDIESVKKYYPALLKNGIEPGGKLFSKLSWKDKELFLSGTGIKLVNSAKGV